MKNFKLKASGIATAVPDKATFFVGTQGSADELEALKRNLMAQSNKLADLLSSLGLKPEECKSTGVSTWQHYTWDKAMERQEFAGYRGSAGVTINLDNLDRLEPIYSALLLAADWRVGSVDFSIADVEPLNRKAYKAALRNAMLLANSLIEELPENNCELLHLTNLEEGSMTGTLQSRKLKSPTFPGRGSDKEQVNLHPGLYEVQAEVIATFGVS